MNTTNQDFLANYDDNEVLNHFERLVESAQSESVEDVRLRAKAVLVERMRNKDQRTAELEAEKERLKNAELAFAKLRREAPKVDETIERLDRAQRSRIPGDTFIGYDPATQYPEYE